MWLGYIVLSKFASAVFWKDKGICQLCGLDLNLVELARGFNGPHLWEADHIIPVVEGGETTMENGRVLCIDCHRSETKKLRHRLRRPRTQGDLFGAPMAAAAPTPTMR